MKFKDRWFYCGECGCLAIKCGICGNTSCNGSGCSLCDNDFIEANKIVNSFGKIIYHPPCDWDRDVSVCKQ